jgi:MFS family permease
VYWSLQGFARLAAGRYLIGVLGGFCLYGAVAPIVMIFNNEPMDIRMMSAVAAVCGFLVGPPVALGLLADSTAGNRNRR